MTHTAHNINIFFKVCEDHVCIKVALHNPTKPCVVAALSGCCLWRDLVAVAATCMRT